ncbi:four helix bundle protein [Geomesophilobacter sediminis]|uniref:Four helix bundle protein n=1 Tax=Geomesophilobacter sediminis TaxID=2798584 RepID=A0A8J7IYM7_9BACT|nr:four helix bundle protein [Geomesophilobacter sediminis]MBJ6725312.1 four helix bundle protein [Geomesophilobacter sediminis]
MGGGKKNPAYDKACAFAIRIVNAYRHLTEEHREYVMSKQLLKSGTLIGANLAEANGAISWAELSAKVSIPYKESQETKYWLWLLKETNYINDKAFDSLFNDLNELAAILYIILRKTRFRKNAANNSLPPSTT